MELMMLEFDPAPGIKAAGRHLGAIDEDSISVLNFVFSRTVLKLCKRISLLLGNAH